MPADALEIATAGGAACLGRDDIGALEPGRRADVVVWPADDIADIPHPVDGLVLGPDRRAREVYVEGRRVVAGGALVGADLPAMRRDLVARARRLWP
jgi:cytosine/adenosine deaminase-related metal-dependent hydrolase